MTKRFDGLSKAQERVLALIAMGVDGGHHPKTLAVLLRRGLIEERERMLFPLSNMPVTVKMYEMPLSEHFRWCQWCEEHDVDMP